MYTNIAGILLLIVSIILLFLIYFIAQDAFSDRLLTLQRLGIAGIPNPNFFKWIWPLFILTTCIGFYLLSCDSYVGFRWIGLLILTLLTAFFLFGNDGFALWPFAALTLFCIIILLGESIYNFGINSQSRLGAALLGFYFFWSIYALYIVLTTLILFINNAVFEWR